MSEYTIKITHLRWLHGNDIYRECDWVSKERATSNEEVMVKHRYSRNNSFPDAHDKSHHHSVSCTSSITIPG
jgi:hypothetical protein